MRTAWFSVGFAFAVVSACGGPNTGGHPSAPQDTGGTDAGTSRGGSWWASHPQGDAGALENAGLGGEGTWLGGDGGISADPVFETAGAPPLALPGVCDPEMALGAEAPQDVSAAAITLLAMTADELSIAFIAADVDGNYQVHVADRVSVDAGFTQVGVALNTGYEPEGGASLSSDGCRLILVLPNHAGFGELTRAARGDAFAGELDVTAFNKINSLKPMSGRALGWPVISSDDEDLYFLSYFGEGLVNQSHRGDDGVFDFGSEIDVFTLGGGQGNYKLINGLSADQRAIFFYDEASKHEMVLFRSRPGAPFYDPFDLGERRGASPNQDCSRVYSSVAGSLVVQGGE